MSTIEAATAWNRGINFLIYIINMYNLKQLY